MADVVSIGTKRRRYDKRTKAAAVVKAEHTSQLAAAEAMGIPRKTLAYWVESEEFANLRQKTREELAGGSIVLAHLAQAELQRKVLAGEVEPRDLAVIYGIAIDKGQLLSGQVTHRTETVTGGMNDHERAALHDLLLEAVREPA